MLIKSQSLTVSLAVEADKEHSNRRAVDDPRLVAPSMKHATGFDDVPQHVSIGAGANGVRCHEANRLGHAFRNKLACFGEPIAGQIGFCRNAAFKCIEQLINNRVSKSSSKKLASQERRVANNRVDRQPLVLATVFIDSASWR